MCIHFWHPPVYITLPTGLSFDHFYCWVLNTCKWVTFIHMCAWPIVPHFIHTNAQIYKHTRVFIYHVEMNKWYNSHVTSLSSLSLLFMCVHMFTCRYVYVLMDAKTHLYINTLCIHTRVNFFYIIIVHGCSFGTGMV